MKKELRLLKVYTGIPMHKLVKFLSIQEVAASYELIRYGWGMDVRKAILVREAAYDGGK